MRIYTAHTRPRRPPVLVREGFSFAGLILGPFWLLAHRAWIAGVLALCGLVAIPLLAPRWSAGVLVVSLAWLIGLFGQDLRRWALARDGFTLVHIVAAPDEDSALARLLDRRPDLIEAALR